MKSIIRSFRKMLQASAGFTMIELLVVIAVIGVLAVAVLSAINPIEQINKGRDTGSRSDAGEIISAAERYFATQQEYPWNVTRTAGTYTYTPSANCSAQANQVDTGFACEFLAIPPASGTDTTWNWLYQLSDTQEVKPAFVSRVINDKKLTVVREAGSNSSVYVCFKPSSQSFKLEAAKNCNTTGTTPTGSQVATIGSGTNQLVVCADTTGATTGTAFDNNYICLP